MLRIPSNMKNRPTSWVNLWKSVFREDYPLLCHTVPQTSLSHPTQLRLEMPQCFNRTSQPSWTLLYTQDHGSSLPLLAHHSLHPVSLPHNLRFTLSPVVYLKYKSFLLCSKAYLQNKSKFLYWTQLYHLHSFIFHHTSSTLSHTLWPSATYPLPKHAIWITPPTLWAHYSLFL